MEGINLLSPVLLLGGTLLLLLAALGALLQRTRGLAGAERVRAMAGLAWGSIARFLPCRSVVLAFSVGLGGFLLGGLVCLAASGGLLWWYASTLPEEENVVAGAAGAALLGLLVVLALFLSVAVGSACGVVAGSWAGSRWERQHKPAEEPGAGTGA